MKYLLALVFSVATFSLALAQPNERREKITLDGEVVTALITETDTIIIADLEDVYVSSPRAFSNRAEYRRYLKYRRYSAKVYPYAVDAIRIFREVDYVTQNMKRGKKKRHIKRLQKEYKKEFKGQLKNLTKTQGKILIKMIERELNRPFFDLVKELRGGFTATYWHELGKLYGYDLKRGYIKGDDPILDAVLQDFDISYELDVDSLKED